MAKNPTAANNAPEKDGGSGDNLQSLQAIYARCRRKTKIVYNDAGFFTPHLRNINYLSVGRSRIISSWLTISLELIYRAYCWLRGRWQALWRWLSPKPMDAPVVGQQQDAALVGRLVFDEPEKAPIHHVHLVFWQRSWLLQWRKLAEGMTDENGEFELLFDLRASRRLAICYRRLEIYQTHYHYRGNRDAQRAYTLFKSLKIPGRDLVGMRYNLREIALSLWLYRDDVSVPRVVIKHHDKDAPQYYSQGRNDALREQFVPIELTKLDHLARIETDPDGITIPQIQADYPPNLTVCMEHEQPGITRGDSWFGLRMMNGMYAATFLPDEEKPGRYHSRIFGMCNYEVNDEYAFPTVELSFDLNREGVPMPRQITLVGALTASNSDRYQSRSFTPEDGDKWLQAKRVARVTGALSTELDDHFTGTHLTTEQFAIAAYRNLRLSPIAALLFPHLKEVVLVNHSADSILVGPAKPAPQPSSIRDGGLILWLQDKLDRWLNRVGFETGGYIPQASALTSAGISERVRDLLGAQDWKDWQPMQPISQAHDFPRAQAEYWGVLGEYLDDFFASHRDEIAEHWLEIYRFSKDLVAHSVPVFLSNVELDKLDEKARKLAEERLAWYQHRYQLDLSLPRDEIDGERKVISPITHSREFRQVDFDQLKAACRYIIMQATYMHSFVNEHQYDDIGEVLYNSLGLRFGDGKDGVMAPESDTRIAPDLTRATQMMWFSNLLSRTEYGFIVRNEEGDINPALVEMLNARRERIERYGMQINNIESRTNI